MSYAVARQQIALLRWQSAHVPTETWFLQTESWEGRGERKCETLWERIGCRAYWEINWLHRFRLQLNLSKVSLAVTCHCVRYYITHFHSTRYDISHTFTPLDTIYHTLSHHSIRYITISHHSIRYITHCPQTHTKCPYYRHTVTFPIAAVLHSLLTLALEGYKQSASRSGPVPPSTGRWVGPRVVRQVLETKSFLEIIDSSTVLTLPATLCPALHHFQTNTSFRKIHKFRPVNTLPVSYKNQSVNAV
jgi:hypothetical protein